MKCDLCNKPAVVHETVIRNGAKTEVHLCADHAAEKGLAVGVPPVVHMMSQLIQAGGPLRAGRVASCPGCGMTILEFRQSGTLGCARCYEAFQPDLGALIERAQGGATHHVGRAPRRAPGAVDRSMHRQRLVHELEAAVAAAQYERAARLRDRLHKLDQGEPERES